MIFEFNYVGEPKEYLLINSILPSPKVGIILLFISILLILIYWLKRSKSNYNYLNNFTLIISSISLLGTYIYSSRYTDEVFVNLEHSYNLFHHGLFSFSPTRMVDGTVEFLYYVLLTPFAFGRSILVKASFFLGAIICWFHLFLLWKLLSNRNLELKLILLILFATSVPLIEIFSSGFGNGFVSLFFFLSIYFQLKGKDTKALLVASILPLIRPDAIIYSFTIFFVELIKNKRIRFTYITLTFVSLLVYFCLVRLLYGHWIPTPIAFKSFKLSMISLIPKDNFFSLINYFQNPFHFLAGFLIFIACLIHQTMPKSVKNLLYYFIPLIGIFIFYQLTIISHAAININSRYFVGFEFFLPFFSIIFLESFINNQKVNLIITPLNNDNSKIFDLSSIFFKEKSRLLLYTTCFFSVLLVVMAAHFRITGLALGGSVNLNQLARITDLGVGGQIIDEVLPHEWAIATTELNTFGYMNDREIIDLWGYTNPEIAHSSICSAIKIRIEPNFFNKYKPNVNWWYTSRESMTLDAFREKFIYGVLSSASDTRLGDSRKVIDRYNFVILKTTNQMNIIFIKKELTEQLFQELSSKKYNLLGSKSIDFEHFKRRYNSRKHVLYQCG